MTARRGYDGVAVAAPVTVPYVRYSVRSAHWWLARALAEVTRRAGLKKEAVDGLTVATHFRGFNVLDGEVTDFKNEAWASDISLSRPFDESKLIMPETGRVQPLPEMGN